MKVYAATDIGRVRPINEDSYYAPKPGERFCAVADGMGGHNAGEVASAMAVRVLEEEMRAPISPTEEALRRAVERANEQIWRASKEREGCAGMGTTITALCMEGNIAHIAQVGDSRAYLIRNRAIFAGDHRPHAGGGNGLKRPHHPQRGPQPPQAQLHHPRPRHRGNGRSRPSAP